MTSKNPTDGFRDLAGRAPDEATFFWSGGPIEVAERTWFQSQFSGCTGFDTDEGVVLVDTGMERLAPALAAKLREKTRAPVHTAIYTHGHVDHAHGLAAFLAPGQPAPRVVAHRAVPERFARYARTARHNAAVNARQFGGTVSDATSPAYATFAKPPTAPTQLYDDRLELRVGGVRFELHHARGETDDHTWVWCPDRGVLCTGDLFIWVMPNAGNPQKAQRYPWDWARALRAMAAQEPATLCPGHGGPVVRDAAKVRHMLLSTAEFLEALVERTLAVLEDASPPHVDVVRRVEIPPHDLPWLRPLYDEAEFLVRSVIRYFGGWWSGRPSELKPAPRAAVAQEMASLAGGARALAARAEAIAQRGDLALACHVADYALEADPADEVVRDAVVALYERRAEGESSLMARNLFRSAAAYAREGRPFA
ncbi:MAG: MBL fold metallo-hydrolase [Proteobacteria bacterium]|nr:MAG: MBL fold metallo-hydrolase [Pseudomonadota bacterium]